MAKTNLQEAVDILTLVNALEPAGIELVKTFLKDIQGKSAAELLGESTSIWQAVIDKANTELGNPA